MNSNLTVRPYQPAFKANFADKFLDAADAYYKTSKSAKEYKQFCSAVRRFSEIPNSDKITISYNKIFSNGKNSYALYASEEGKEGTVVLTVKDQFRKLLKKFSYMNEYEFKIKTGLIEKAE